MRGAGRSTKGNFTFNNHQRGGSDVSSKKKNSPACLEVRNDMGYFLIVSLVCQKASNFQNCHAARITEIRQGEYA